MKKLTYLTLLAASLLIISGCIVRNEPPAASAPKLPPTTNIKTEIQVVSPTPEAPAPKTPAAK